MMRHVTSLEDFLNESALPKFEWVPYVCPPEPGTIPIPTGYVRLYHYTGAEAEVIAREGLKMSKAEGNTYHEPDMIWAATEPPTEARKVYVEFAVKWDDEGWILNRPKSPTYYDDKYQHVGFIRDIKPEEFIAIHEPWNDVYRRYLMNDPEKLDSIVQEILAGEHDYTIKRAKSPSDQDAGVLWAALKAKGVTYEPK